MKMANSAISYNQRVIRVFVSSTFQDMKEEREELVKRVFPRLRKICEQRGVTWGEVDLRWGITDEQKAEGKVLPICLEEINECRPYFICMLGERYGHVPEEIPDDLIKREPWLSEHKSKSVTELEILHGVLNNPEMADHAYFYIRDSHYADSLPYEEKPEHREKLDILKYRIRKSGLSVQENYPDPEALGELVFNDLKAVIEERFPEGSELEPLDREAQEHEAFAQAKHRIYIGRREYFDRLDDHMEGNGQPLVVLGESGSGKSALVANWAVKYRKKNPENYIVLHFIGSTPYSSDWSAMLRRIMGEFKRWFDMKDDIPSEPDKLRAAFANWLHMASAAVGRENRKIILILDALNQLQDRDQAQEMVWLPPFIPENIWLILSTLPGRPLDDLRKREWSTMEVEPLKDDERKQLIKEYLAQYRKTLSVSQLDRIASADQTRNPLYLRALLEELRIFGEHKLLEERIEHYLEAENVQALYAKIFERFEEDYERDRPGIVGDALTHLWASRRGLSETELLELLGTNGEPLPQAYWAPFYIAADKLFVNRSGLIGFSHDFQRQAIENRYLPSKDDKKSSHIRLADYFSNQELTSRKVDELPWQLSEAEDWQRLYDLLSDLEFFKAAWEKDEFDVKGYWAKIEDSSKLSLVDAYQIATDCPEEVPDWDVLMYLSELLKDAGHPNEALELTEFLIKSYRKTGNKKQLARCLREEGMIHRAFGEYDKAMQFYRESEFICRELGDKYEISANLGNQGLVLEKFGDYKGAMKLYKEMERISGEIGHKRGLVASYTNQGLILCRQGDFDGAMKLHKEAERISRELGDRLGLSISLSNQGVVLQIHGDQRGSLLLFKASERIYRELGLKYGLSVNLGNQASIFFQLSDYDHAMKLLEEQEHISRSIGDKEMLSSSLGNQALVLDKRGDCDGAMKLLEEQERIGRETGILDQIVRSLINQGDILKEMGKLDDAEQKLNDAEQICQKIDAPQYMVYILVHLADLNFERKNLEKALSLAEKSYELASMYGYSGETIESRAVLDKIRVALNKQNSNKS